MLKTLCFISFFVTTVLLSSCKHTIHVYSKNEKNNVTLGDRNLGTIPKEGRLIEVSSGFGPVEYKIENNNILKERGVIPRSEKNGLITGLSISAAAFLIPVMTTLGLLVANPSWIEVPYKIYQNPHEASIFMKDTASSYTIPITAIFAVVGMLPLLGLLTSESLPNELTIGKI